MQQTAHRDAACQESLFLIHEHKPVHLQKLIHIFLWLYTQKLYVLR